MLRLSAEKTEPFWLDASKVKRPYRPILGFKVKVKPVTVAMILAARTAASNALLEALEAKVPNAQNVGQFAFTRSLVLDGVVEWKGVCGPNNKALKATPENIDNALRNVAVFDFFDRQYVLPALPQADEKNAYSPSRNITSRAAAAKRTAKAASKSAGAAAPTAPTS